MWSIAGIRETLEESDDDDDDDQAVQSGRTATNRMNGTILFGHDPYLTGTELPDPPNENHRAILLDLYRERVDCLFKATYFPAAYMAITEQYTTAVVTPYRCSVKALERAVYYISVCTLTDEECESR